MNIPTGSLYILIEYRFCTNNIEVVKIGKTDRTVAERQLDYPKGSKLLGSGAVYNSKNGEDELIRKFTKKFTRYFARSREYYYGNLDQMITYFHKCILKIHKQQMRPIHDESFYKKHKPLPLAHTDKYMPENSNDITDIDDTYIDNISDIDVLDCSDDSNNNVNVQDNQNNIGNIDLSKTAHSNMEIISESVVQKTTKTIQRNSFVNKNLASFCRYVYDTKPDWYLENKKVAMSTIYNAYIEYLDDPDVHIKDSTLSGQLSNLMYSKGQKYRDSKGCAEKKLYSYEKMKQQVGF